MSDMTSTTNTDTYLTDDELTAVAVELNGAWPLPLPTVAVEDATALEAAALRGLRSLILRGGYDADTGLTPSLSSLAQVLGSTTALVAYVGDDDGRVLGWDVGYGAAPSSDGWLLDEINALGVHRLSWVASDDAVAEFFTTVLSAVADGQVPAGDGRALCLSRATGSGARVLAVSPTARQLLELDADARPVSRDGLVGTIGDAVRTLIEG